MFCRTFVQFVVYFYFFTCNRMEMYLLEICLIPVSLNCVQPNSNSG